MADVCPGWAMLDRFVSSTDANTSLPEKGYRPLRAQGTTSQGVNFGIALCLADPPGTSRLYVLSPSGARPVTACDVMAAHGNHFLFMITDFIDLLCYQDLFICRVISPDKPPLLKRLPPWNDRLVAGMVDGAEITLQRLFFQGDAGLLCRDEQVFAVAQLDRLIPISDSNTWDWEAEIAVLNTDGKGDGAMWEVKRLPIFHPERENLDLSLWSTDAVISFKNYICWVDYCMGGILFFDVFKGRPDTSYLDLPPTPHHPPRNRGYLEMYRGVSVTDEGRLLKFVHVDRIDGKLDGPSDSGYTITSHTLKITEDGGMRWVHGDIMQSDEDEVLPSVHTFYDFSILKFPLVSMEKAHVVHFLYSEPMDDVRYKISVVTVDMSAKALLSTHPYIKGEDRFGEDADMYDVRCCKLKSFLPIRFPMSVTRKRKLLD